MTCPVCGKEPPCKHGWRSDAILTERQQTAGEIVSAEDSPSHTTVNDRNWRNEVTSRVQQHRARRRRPGDSDLAMELDFPPQEALTVTEEPVVRERMYRRLPESLESPAAERSHGSFSGESPKLIRFPRSLSATASDPVMDEQFVPELMEESQSVQPRILDVGEQELTVSDSFSRPESEAQRPAEQMELLPSFEDIRLEPGHTRVEIETEVIPRPAPLQQRAIGGLVDVAVVIAAAALFDFTFVRLTEDDPHSRMALLFGLLVSGVLWIGFQYLFLVHGTGTPGMHFAQLELSTFEGKPVAAHARRRRAMASTLSAMSVGLGYAWALVDEDRLGWHDRITRTLLHSSAEPSASNDQFLDW